MIDSLSSVEPCIPLTLSSDDSIRFFINKIVSIREKIDGLLPTIITDVSSSAAALEVPLGLSIGLRSGQGQYYRKSEKLA